MARATQSATSPVAHNVRKGYPRQSSGQGWRAEPTSHVADQCLADVDDSLFEPWRIHIRREAQDELLHAGLSVVRRELTIHRPGRVTLLSSGPGSGGRP